MERLLRFAVEHDRVIRLMFMRDGRLFQVNAHIVSYDDKQVSFVTTRSPRTQVISREELLAVDFRRGDVVFFVFFCGAGLFLAREFRLCGGDQRAMKTDERLRSPFGNLRCALPCFLSFTESFLVSVLWGSSK